MVVNVGTDPFPQIIKLVPNGNAGGIFGLTVTVNVNGNAHKPAVGVNVYVPEFWLSTTAGLQVPVIALSEVVGNVGAVAPAHNEALLPKLNVGGTFGLTVTFNEVGTAH